MICLCLKCANAGTYLEKAYDNLIQLALKNYEQQNRNSLILETESQPKPSSNVVETKKLFYTEKLIYSD